MDNISPIKCNSDSLVAITLYINIPKHIKNAHIPTNAIMKLISSKNLLFFNPNAPPIIENTEHNNNPITIHFIIVSYRL